MAELINPRQGLPAFEEAPFVARKCDEDVDLKQILVELQVQRDAQASRQLELLQEIEEELASRTTPLYFISNALLQWLLVATAFIFGTFASHGTDLQVDGNYLSVLQNQMNLVSFCQASNSVEIPSHIEEETNVNMTLEHLCSSLRRNTAKSSCHDRLVG